MALNRDRCSTDLQLIPAVIYRDVLEVKVRADISSRRVEKGAGVTKDSMLFA